MPVKISDSTKTEDIVEVEHICEGCGQTIREFEAFADSVDSDIRPVHDSISCMKEAE